MAIDGLIKERAVRVGLVGYGLAGAAFHAPLITSTPGLDLVAIMTSRDVPTGIAKAGSFDELMAMDVDLVVVASPNDSHVPLARAALDVGAHVVVDKPLAVTVDEAESLVVHAEARGLLLSVFQNRRWDGDYLTLRQLVADDQLGPIHRFESRFERWRPEVSELWRESSDPARGGGLLLDLGTHLIDQAVQLFGRVESVYAEVRAIRPGAVVEDDVFVALRHQTGQLSHLWMSAVAAEQGPRMRAWGTRGAWSTSALDVQEDQLRAGRTPLDEGFGWNPPGRLNGAS
ncbi:MAG TPA: Gfo/Idh/MocA family oxidoreductase, partial [Marmoricola sp.]|nr:Gfo/Idh/MocA family oxidoreductase [Marmoricola sp.]